MAAPPPKPGQPGQPGQPKEEVGTGFKRYKWEFKDSNKEFWVMGHAEVKIISLVCIIVGLHMFESVATHPLLILLLTMELSLIAFYMFLYSFAINRYLPFIFWPVTDLINDLVCCAFLIGGIVFALHARNTLPMAYLTAMILMGVAAFFAIVDLCLQRKHLKAKKLRKLALLAPDKDGHMPDPALHAMLEAQREEEEARQKEQEERERKQKEEELKKKKAMEKKKAKKERKKKKKEANPSSHSLRRSCVFDALMVVKTMSSNRKKAPRIVPATAPSRLNLR
ncbi:CKLF-like MARVEL transmembrane domain-containing protein 2B [Meriones unguiculatus]|uniref:CKLF-like MARVEL transmembrane domain-containing protein 2B n=1 Tax=Meriones unguiculatus TaxID=10047 RepID=UPI00293F4422|nr:CKLF-like MARVEL transmembrane domain-containing protein 2B [Meriones unguiculatus]